MIGGFGRQLTILSMSSSRQRERTALIVQSLHNGPSHTLGLSACSAPGMGRLGDGGRWTDEAVLRPCSEGNYGPAAGQGRGERHDKRSEHRRECPEGSRA